MTALKLWFSEMQMMIWLDPEQDFVNYPNKFLFWIN